jgi:hypothetical protein
MSVDAQLRTKTKLLTVLISFFIFSAGFSLVSFYPVRPSIQAKQELVIRHPSRRKLVSYVARAKSSFSQFVRATRDPFLWFRFFHFNFEIRIFEQFKRAKSIISSQVNYFIFFHNPRVYSLDVDAHHC